MIRTDIKRLLDIPNIGPASVANLKLLGIQHPQQLAGRDPYQMFETLCQLTGKQHDPCVIDIFISAIRYMEGEPAKKWWAYTTERKKQLKRI